MLCLASSHVSYVDPGLDLVQVAAGPFLCPHQPLELCGRGGFVPAVCPLAARRVPETSEHVWKLLLRFSNLLHKSGTSVIFNGVFSKLSANGLLVLAITDRAKIINAAIRASALGTYSP